MDFTQESINSVTIHYRFIERHLGVKRMIAIEILNWEGGRAKEFNYILSEKEPIGIAFTKLHAIMSEDILYNPSDYYPNSGEMTRW